MSRLDRAIAELILLAGMRADAAREAIKDACIETEPNEIADQMGLASMYAGDAKDFCRLADAIRAEDIARTFQIWNTMDTDPREAVFTQAPTAHKIIHVWAENDNG